MALNDQGTISVSTPFTDDRARLNDGKVPGNARVQFTAYRLNWYKDNVGGIPQLMADWRCDDKPVFQVHPTTRPAHTGDENGGRGAMIRLCSPATAGRYFGIEYDSADGDQGVYMRINDRRMFRFEDLNNDGAVAQISAYGTNRLMFYSPSSIVFGAGNNHYEIEGGTTGPINITPYGIGSSHGKELYFSTNGQDAGTEKVPLAAYSTVAGLAAFAWGAFDIPSGAAVKNGKLNPDGSIWIENTTTPATPATGGTLFVEAGALKYIGSGGTVTVIAQA